MTCHSSSKRPSKAPYLALKTKIFNSKFQDRLCIMITCVRVWGSFRSTIVPIVPCKNINVLSDEKLQPKTVWRMDLLLIDLSIWTEKDDCWILLVLRRLIVLNVSKWIIFFHLFYCLNLFIIKREEHAVKLSAILCLDPKPSPIKIFLEQTLRLIM